MMRPSSSSIHGRHTVTSRVPQLSTEEIESQAGLKAKPSRRRTPVNGPKHDMPKLNQIDPQSVTARFTRTGDAEVDNLLFDRRMDEVDDEHDLEYVLQPGDVLSLSGRLVVFYGVHESDSQRLVFREMAADRSGAQDRFEHIHVFRTFLLPDFERAVVRHFGGIIHDCPSSTVEPLGVMRTTHELHPENKFQAWNSGRA